MDICLIAALSDNQVIGVNNQLPWHLPSDLANFKALTLNKPVVMGRKTYESIGRLLPHRRNIILSHQSNYQVAGAEVVASLEDGLKLLGDEEQVMVIGGEAIYRLAMPYANRLYLTRVNCTLKGDCFFPEINRSDWSQVVCQSHPADETHQYSYDFLVFDRVAGTLKR